MKYTIPKTLLGKNQSQNMSLFFHPYRIVFLPFLTLTLIITLFAKLAHPAEVTLEWESVIAADGYKVYYGLESGQYQMAEDVGSNTRHKIQLDPGTYFFAVTAYNRYGESDYSKEVSNAPTSVNLSSDLTSPQLEGTLVTFTAEATGGSGDYEYLYILINPPGGGKVIRDYSSSAFFTLDTTGLGGIIYIWVWARNAGADALLEVSGSLEYGIVPLWLFN